MEIVAATLIDDYLENRLSEDERMRLEEHFRESEKWQAKLKFALALRKATEVKVRKPKLPRLYLAIAATVLVALGMGFGVWRFYFQRSEVARGLSALASAYREQRP